MVLYGYKIFAGPTIYRDEHKTAILQFNAD